MHSILLFLSALGTAQAVYNPHHANKALVRRSIVADPSALDGQSFDFVIAGGGTAGLALASRLSSWSNITVAVIEAGGDGTDVQDQIDIPGYSYLNSLGGSSYDWKYKTVPQTNANNTVKSWPRGKGLGGSSATNGLFWSRGTEEEYEAWNTLNPNGTENWGWETMKYYINKAEDFSPPTDDQTSHFDIPFDTSVHGSEGLIQIGYSSYIYDSVKEWIPAWVNLNKTTLDHHSGKNVGASFSPSTINISNQTRCDSKAGYIDTLPRRTNLVILTGYQVTRIAWNSTGSDGAVASGLKFKSSSAGANGQEYFVSARKEVILSGGTVNSPQILQLSGVGPKSLLSGLGIDVVSDLPVGYGLQDHVSTAIKYTTPEGTLTWGNLIDPDQAALALSQYKAGNYSSSQWTYVNEATGYVSLADINPDYLSYSQVASSALDQNVQAITSWHSLPDNVAAGYRAQYEIQNGWLQNTEIGHLEIILTMLDGTDGAGIQAALQHPYSRGSIFINSTNPFDYPVIDPNYFGMGYDVDILSQGLEWTRTLGATDPLNSLLLMEHTPGADVTGSALSDYIYTSSGTEYHPLGTCAMLPMASGGVVDTQLKVYGTKNVRVVDAGIMPLQISAHLMASTYGVAEKAADMIKAEYVFVAPIATSSSASASVMSTSSIKSTATSASSPTVSSGTTSSNKSGAGQLISARGLEVALGVGLLSSLFALAI